MPGFDELKMNAAKGFFTAETQSALRLRREKLLFLLCVVSAFSAPLR